MNRPPKKKKQRKDGLVEDPRFSREELEQADAPKSAPQTKGDDRNLVEIDDAFAEADFEDRMWLYWHKNKVSIIAAIVIAILGVVGVNTWQMMQQSQRAALQEEYGAAVGDPAQLQSFGAANSKTLLGGLALLQAADAKYEAGEYPAAVDLYRQSLEPLQKSVVVFRARLGMGVSQIKAGQTDQGKQSLRSLLDASSAISSIRAEAAVELAQIELAEGNRDAAADLLKRVDSLPNADYWKSRAKTLLQMENLDESASEG